jgi:anthranilate synthase component 1
MPIVEFEQTVTETRFESNDEPRRCFLRLLKRYGRRYNFFLESVFDPGATVLAKQFSRFSIICCEPLLVVKTKGSSATLEGDKRILAEIGGPLGKEFAGSDGKYSLGEKDPLHFLRAVMRHVKCDATNRLRFSFGPVGYVSYDVAKSFEPSVPSALPDALRTPDMCFVLHRNVVVFDHQKMKAHFATHSLDGDGNAKRLADAALHGDELVIKGGRSGEVGSNTSEAEFAAMIAKAQEYIRSGDIFQVVLSRRMSARTSKDPLGMYFSLREINPSPYMFYMDFGAFQLLGASPETQVRLQDGVIEMRPIAGTRGRGASAAEERSIAERMLADEKERAEHTMLVDLCRNDVGRVAEIGSVKEPQLLVIEKYSHVQHIVSHVIGRLRKGLDAYDVFRATFPAGTVSGAPKVRAMQIIDELEKSRRGPYAGAVGYFDLKGNMDFAILIRSVLMKDGVAHVQAGAGIVLDSHARGEFIETERKAGACLKAIMQ